MAWRGSGVRVPSAPPNLVTRSTLVLGVDLRHSSAPLGTLGPCVPRPAALRLRAALAQQGPRIAEILGRYGAANPRLFGSVARGDASDDSDLDLIVDLVPGAGNELLRVAGLSEELSELLDVRVDVVSVGLLRREVSASALADAVAV